MDREMILAFIKRLDLKKEYTIEITKKRIKRTLSQNNLYWLWLCCIEFETGNDRNDLHDYFKRRYLMPETIEVFNEEQIRYSTKHLNTLQFKTYLDKIQVFASTELGIHLPDPDDKRWEDFYSFYSEKL